MKHRNLQILAEHQLPVPPFIVVRDGSIDLSFSRAEYFAVRSSYEEEDSANHSFAGQFDTFLNVKRCDVPQAVQKVLASCHRRNVHDYLKAAQKDGGGKMCVIVQEMVCADFSGVIFTANPLGILNETVITVGSGLGSGVVEDQTPTTTYYCNQDDGIYLLQQQPGAPVLPEQQLQQLVEQSRKIKEIVHYDADIEFAIHDGDIFFLQVRPITTISKGEQIILDNSNIVESYPGVTLPLTQGFVKTVYTGIFTNCIRRVTNDPALVKEFEPCLSNMVDTADWRIYYRINNWYEVLRLLPFSNSIIRIWQEMLGLTNTTVPENRQFTVKKSTKRRVVFRFFKYLISTPREMDQLNRSFIDRYEQYRHRASACQTVDECMELFFDIYDDILVDWDITLVNDIYTFIFTALSGKRNKERIADVRNLESMKPLLAMNDLMALAKSEGQASPAYLEAEKQYIDLYGDRCLGELKMETRTYRVDPMLLRRQVKTGTAFVPPNPTKGRFENPIVKRAKLGIKNREISRMNRSRLFGISRQIFLKVGQLLTEQGRLACPEDVFYLYFEELTQSADFRLSVQSRKEQEILYRNMPTFSRLVYSNGIVNHKVCGQGQMLVRKNVLSGIPTSVGVAEGEVVVIEEPDGSMDTTGKILVTRSTDPGWVFLIQNARGIIAEKGSLLSHTAIISRELHKPAVVNVKDCTKLLKSGDYVHLDANEGTVTTL